VARRERQGVLGGGVEEHTSRHASYHAVFVCILQFDTRGRGPVIADPPITGPDRLVRASASRTFPMSPASVGSGERATRAVTSLAASRWTAAMRTNYLLGSRGRPRTRSPSVFR
jgi:hypothetical protein